MKRIAVILFLSLTSLTSYCQNIACPDFVCELDINITAYSVPATPGSTYTWNITGGNIVAGQGTNTIQVDWSATIPGNYAVEVIETDINGCIGNIVLCDVTVTPTPVTGPITHD
jgi:hypothetical protein